jgi:hypothetical protein
MVGHEGGEAEERGERDDLRLTLRLDNFPRLRP